MGINIQNFFIDSFKKLGFKNVIISDKDDKYRIAGLDTLNEQETQILSEKIKHLDDEMSHTSIDFSDYTLELNTDINIELGVLGQPYKKKIKLPALPKARRIPDRDLSFSQFLELFEVVCCYLRSFALASKIQQLSFIQHSIDFNSREAEGYSLCFAQANCAMMDYWFGRVLSENKEASVELLFNNWWAVDYYRFVDETGNPPKVRITGCLGTPGIPVGKRRLEVGKMDSLLQRLKIPFQEIPRLEFRINAYGTRLHELGEDYLFVLQPIADELGHIVESIKIEKPKAIRAAVIDFSNKFVVETHTQSLMPRISFYLPWFHGSRLGMLESPEAFGEAARADLQRAEKVRTWMAETNNGRMEMFFLDSFHASFGMDDKRLDILLDALTPHINAIKREEGEPYNRVWFYLEKPSKSLWQDENYIKIPMPHLENKDIKSFIDNWFEDNPLPEK